MSACHPYGWVAFSGLATARSRPMGIGVSVVQALPTDAIGTMSLTLNHLVDGSAIQLESQDGTTTLHNSVVSGTSKTVLLNVYASGNPLNDIRIKVRKGSAAPYYQPFETLLTATVGSESLYINQISD